MAALPVAANAPTDGTIIASGPLGMSAISYPEQSYPQGLETTESFADVNQELPTWLEGQSGMQIIDNPGEIRLEDYELNGFDQIWDWGSLGFDIV